MASAKQNAALSKELWKYQQSNAHQLEVQDLREAGLNPILSATNGQLAGMPSVSGSDYGVGDNITSALNTASVNRVQKENKLLDYEIDSKRLENEQAKFNFEKEKFDYEKELIAAQARNLNTQSDYYTGKNAREIALNDANIRKIDNDIKNANIITDAQAKHLAAGAHLQSEQARKVSYEISKIVFENYGISLENQQLESILTDPRRVNERKQLEAGLRGENALGILMNLGLVGKEINGVFPSRIGIGFSRR